MINKNIFESEVSLPIFSKHNAMLGRLISWLVSTIIIIYLITLILGFNSLETPNEPIGNPYFTMLELLIILLSPLMVFCLIIVHKSTPESLKIYSLAALIFITIMASITCCIHFIVLTLSQQHEFIHQEWATLVFSFKWPSFVYALDILAWDFFFALSMLFLSLTFRKKGLETVIRVLLTISGLLSLAGLLGIPLDNMQVRNIGIIGYTIFAIVVFFLLGMTLNHRVIK